MMRYMLDTNICIFAIKKKPETAIRNLLEHSVSEMCVSAITYAELMHGVENSATRDKNMAALTMFLSHIAILPFDDKAAMEYGNIRTALQRQGTPIGPMDTLIAAHARALGLTVVTNNTREFERVEGLSVEDWAN